MTDILSKADQKHSLLELGRNFFDSDEILYSNKKCRLTTIACDFNKNIKSAFFNKLTYAKSLFKALSDASTGTLTKAYTDACQNKKVSNQTVLYL